MDINNIIKNCKFKVVEIIKTYTEKGNLIIKARKTKKDENTPINLVINSSFIYENKELNILKECLDIWSESGKKIYSSLDFDWIYVNPEMKEKLYFISSTKKELKRFHLYDLVDNKILSSSYMDSYFDSILYKSNGFRENYLNNSKIYDLILG